MTLLHDHNKMRVANSLVKFFAWLFDESKCASGAQRVFKIEDVIEGWMLRAALSKVAPRLNFAEILEKTGDDRIEMEQGWRGVLRGPQHSWNTLHEPVETDVIAGNSKSKICLQCVYCGKWWGK